MMIFQPLEAKQCCKPGQAVDLLLQQKLLSCAMHCRVNKLNQLGSNAGVDSRWTMETMLSHERLSGCQIGR